MLLNLDTVIYNWIKETLDIEVIFAYQNVGRPPLPYCTIYLSNVSQIGHSDLSLGALQDDESVDITQDIPLEQLVSINIFGNDSQSMALSLLHSIQTPKIISVFNSNHIGYLRHSDIRHIFDLVKESYEKRIQFDIYFYILLTNKQNIETIQKVELFNPLENKTTIYEKVI